MTTIGAPSLDELARRAALQLLEHWIREADGAELCDYLYENAQQAGRTDVCASLEANAEGEADTVRGALRALVPALTSPAEPGRHPLPWTMPDREMVHLEPAVVLHEGEPKPYKFRLGRNGGHSAVFTHAEFTMLHQKMGEALAAPFLVLVQGGAVAEPWMRDSVDHRFSEVLRLHPDLVIAHEGRPGSVDDLIAAWASTHHVPQRVGLVDPAAGGSAVMAYLTGNAEQNMAMTRAFHEAHLESWWCQGYRGSPRD